MASYLGKTFVGRGGVFPGAAGGGVGCTDPVNVAGSEPKDGAFTTGGLFGLGAPGAIRETVGRAPGCAILLSESPGLR